MGDAGFVEVTAKQMSIPMYIPDGHGLQDVFTFMTRPTPVNVSANLLCSSYTGWAR